MIHFWLAYTFQFSLNWVQQRLMCHLNLGNHMDFQLVKSWLPFLQGDMTEVNTRNPYSWILTGGGSYANQNILSFRKQDQSPYRTSRFSGTPLMSGDYELEKNRLYNSDYESRAGVAGVKTVLLTCSSIFAPDCGPSYPSAYVKTTSRCGLRAGSLGFYSSPTPCQRDKRPLVGPDSGCSLPRCPWSTSHSTPQFMVCLTFYLNSGILFCQN
ncbi:hypothetical protein J6590_010983 [Homalodisca vitripennis]|nr:hypothetical protein J6590_010983 [Homalodisca vitripennis]